MKRSVVIFFFIFVSVNCAFSQKDTSKAESTAKDVLYKSEYMYGGGVHRIGLQLEYRIVKSKTYFKKRLYSFELLNMQHPKEVRATNKKIEEAKSYKLGKMNSLVILRAGIANQHLITTKESPKNIEIKYNYHFGTSLGFLKPIYLEIAESGETSIERYDPDRAFTYDILGNAPFFTGIGGTKLNPGLYTKFGLHFDFSPEYDRVMAVEVGIGADIFLKEIELMAFTEKQHLILSYYLSAYIGKKTYQ